MESSKFGHVLKSKRIAAIVASVVLASAFSFTKVHAANTIIRYNGIDRYETSAKVCEDGWQKDTDYAVIVSGENFPDAMSAAPLAKKYEAPILLTDRDTMNPYTSVEINRLNVKNVFIIGGKGVVSQSIEDGLKARGIKVTRLGGADRYETGIQVAQKLGKPSEIAVVNGDDFHDGLSISSIAALKGMPVILTGRDYMPSVVKKYLQANKNVDQTYVVGGTEQVSDSVFSLMTNGKRIGYGDAYGRNTGVIDAFKNEISTGTIYIASARDFPDSLVATALAPKTSSVILYVDNPMADATKNFLQSKIVNNIKVLGGLGAISYDTQQAVESVPLGVANIDNVTDTIWQDQKYTPRPTIVVTASDGNVQEVPVSWNLAKVITTKPGIYTINGKLDGTDKTVITTLVVKALPIKIDDINARGVGGDPYSLPGTVNAQMSDGTISQVPVTWDYGTQQASKPGTYVFTGTVDHYARKIKLTLTASIPPQILAIQDIKLKLSRLSDFNSSPYYFNVQAQMSDGNFKNVAVSWNMSNISDYPGFPGVYKCTGTVAGYDATVQAVLIIGGANDPTPDLPTTPDDPNTQVGNITNLSPMDVTQGDPYTLPATAADPASGKQMPVTWTTTNIDTSNVSTDDVETSRVSSMTFVGVLTGSNSRVGLVVNVRPKIVGIEPESLHQTIKKSDYYGINYQLPTKVKAVMQDGSKKNISVLSWDPPYINIGDAQTYNIRGKIKYFNNPVTLLLDVVN